MLRKLTMALNAHKNITAIGRTQQHAFIQWMLKAVRAFAQKIRAEEIYNIDVMKIHLSRKIVIYQSGINAWEKSNSKMFHQQLTKLRIENISVLENSTEKIMA